MHCFKRTSLYNKHKKEVKVANIFIYGFPFANMFLCSPPINILHCHGEDLRMLRSVTQSLVVAMVVVRTHTLHVAKLHNFREVNIP